MKDETTKKAECLEEHSDSLDNIQHDSLSNNSTHKDHNIDFYNSVYDLLPLGGNDPVSASELSMQLKTDQRGVRKVISAMRQNDYLICSNERGYFKPCNYDELLTWYQKAYSTVETTMKTLHHARKLLRQMKVIHEVE